MKYKTILTDNPWTYNNKKTGGSMKSGASQKYETMTLQDICDLPIHKITEKDSVLFMWVTCPLMEEGLKVMKAWGYKYKTKIYWRKIMSLGMGFWYRGQVEELWVCKKGNVKAFRCQKPNFMQSKVGKHSAKPVEAYDFIEYIAPDPKVELFARERRKGWDSIGNDINGRDIRDILAEWD